MFSKNKRRIASKLKSIAYRQNSGRGSGFRKIVNLLEKMIETYKSPNYISIEFILPGALHKK